MFLAIFRAIKFALKNFWRNLWLSVITIFILFLTLFSISLIVSLNLVADQAIKAVKNKVDIDIFFNPETTEENILAAQSLIEEMPEVKNVVYISQALALENFKKDHTEDETIQQSLAELDENPLPASLVVKANDLNDYDAIISNFENSEYNKFTQSKNFSDHKIIINKLNSITKRLYQAGIGVSVVFVFFSIIMVFNTIRIAIYSHREELNIMKLVGATNWFIRGPFLLESVLYGIIGSVLTLGIFYPMIVMIAPYVNHFFLGYDFNILTYFQHYIWYIFIMQLALSLIVSILSSMIAIGKYLKM
ncbi:MAG: permease-like cell division protein FtsX [Patescibacteria group bacterium]